MPLISFIFRATLGDNDGTCNTRSSLLKSSPPFQRDALADLMGDASAVSSPWRGGASGPVGLASPASLSFFPFPFVLLNRVAWFPPLTASITGSHPAMNQVNIFREPLLVLCPVDAVVMLNLFYSLKFCLQLKTLL